MTDRTCSVEGCTGKYRAIGLCRAHYDRLRNASLWQAAPKRSLADRIEEMTIPEPNSGCLIWLGAVSHSKGDPQQHRAKMCFDGTGKSAARAAYLAYRGPIPGGLHVLHRCDTPLCVNPNHLWLGTHIDNMADKTRKDRNALNGAKGEMNNRSRLTEREVIAIRQSTAPSATLASELGVTAQTIRRIRRNATWKHLPPQAA